MLVGGLGRVSEEGSFLPESAELEAELGFQVEEAQSGPGATVQSPKSGRGSGACRHYWVVWDRGFWVLGGQEGSRREEAGTR